MAKLADEIRFGSLPTYNYPASYDSTSLGLGHMMVQQYGASNEDRFVGPMPVVLGRPVETAGAMPGFYPWVYDWSPTKSWVFLADNAATAATRRVQLFECDTSQATFTWKGLIQCKFPFLGTQGTYLCRGFRMTYDKYSVGTVAVNGTALSGTGTNWVTNNIPVGTRIGFGTTDPTAVVSWYELATIVSDTSASLTSTAGVISNGSYVIEDLRAIMALTCTTTTNGGLFVTKGLRYENFNSVTTLIPDATSLDNIRATYWIGDATTSTNTVAFGIGLQDKIDWTTQYAWVGDTLANPVLYKYNIRKPLILATGKDTSNAFVLKTGSGGAVTGTTSQVNNGRVTIANHGPGAGIPCFYFTTTTRVYRTVDLDTVTSLSTTWLSGGDVMVEIPPGGVGTFTAAAVLSNIEYASSIDKFVIMTSGAGAVRSYITEYRTDSGQFDRIFLADTKQINQSTASSDITPYPNTLSLISSVWVQDGILYMTSHGTTAITNLLYAIPMAADWEYASTTNGRIILPRISTPTATKYYRAYVNELKVLGGKTGQNLGASPEPFRVYYRTTGITDDSGSWTLLDSYLDLSGVAGVSAIQFMLEFRTIGLTCIPARVLSFGLMYEDSSTDSHYQPSVKWSDITNKKFAWRFSSSFGGTVPTLRVRLYDAVGGGLLVDNDTVTNSGNFEKSTNDGGAWGAYNSSDKANETTYIRFTPSSLSDNIKVRALITQL